VSPHTFRHTFSVAWLLGDGEFKGDAISLQRILGHRSPAMTQRYVDLTSQDLGRLHARLSPADRMAAPPEATAGRRRRL
jgi:integrase/recombinase XerD